MFAWLTQQREEFGEAMSRTALEAFTLDGRRIPLVGPSGIWKPAACELPLSITTTVDSSYDDRSDPATGALSYAYRGVDVAHRDNRGLRQVMAQRVPIVYFYAIEPGSYVAAYPAFIVGDYPERLRFSVQVDDLFASVRQSSEPVLAGEDMAEPRRAYVTATFRRRLHQVAFRERVISGVRGEVRALSAATCRTAGCGTHHSGS